MSELKENNPIEPVEEGKTTEPTQETKVPLSSSASRRNLVTIAIILVTIMVVVLISWTYKKPSASVGETTKEESHTESEENNNEIILKPETLSATEIELFEVAEQSFSSFLPVTGTIEANQQKLQQASSLISGRVEKVDVVLGDYIKAGTVLAVIASPQIAQLHGKMHEAESKLTLAQYNLDRVEKSENRVAVLSAKAKLDEAEATLRRVKKLVELKAGAGKDLLAAETAYKTAKAEYDFQSNISLNREIAEAKSVLATSEVELFHIRNEMRAYGVPSSEEGHVDHSHNTAQVPLRAPISGTVIERTVNAGAGVEAGKPLFTIADLSNIWVIANIPESQLRQIHIGTKAEIKTAILGEEKLSGKVSYIDPQLNEEARTAKVRIELANPQQKLNLGMFVVVNFLSVNSSEVGLGVPEEALQRIGERTIVFVTKGDKEGHFEVRDIKLGNEVEESSGYHRVVNGLKKGEKVVSKGSFALKTQLMKGELGEE